MKSTVVSDEAGSRTTVAVLDSGEEAFATLTRFADATGISGASLTAIGAFESAVVGWFDFATKSYRKIRVDEQCEVLSAIGDVATGDDGKASLHACRARIVRRHHARWPPARGQGPSHARSCPEGNACRPAAAKAA
jgi:predicted DNA-binding protein with PD1-like motif